MNSSGPYTSIENTPLDFNDTRRIGNHIDQMPDGYDHNMVLSSKEKAADLYHRGSGRFMEVFTTEPGLQFYSGNYLQNTVINEAGGKRLEKYGALCLEAQHHPNSPNEPLFPSTVLRPGDLYRQTTVYRFSVK
jgi:aldose 1-epimerase